MKVLAGQHLIKKRRAGGAQSMCAPESFTTFFQ